MSCRCVCDKVHVCPRVRSVRACVSPGLLSAVLKGAIYVQCLCYCSIVLEASKRVCNQRCVGLGLTAGADIDPVWDLTSVEKVTQNHGRKRMGQV